MRVAARRARTGHSDGCTDTDIDASAYVRTGESDTNARIADSDAHSYTDTHAVAHGHMDAGASHADAAPHPDADIGACDHARTGESDTDAQTGHPYANTYGHMDAGACDSDAYADARTDGHTHTDAGHSRHEVRSGRAGPQLLGLRHVGRGAGVLRGGWWTWRGPAQAGQRPQWGCLRVLAGRAQPELVHSDPSGAHTQAQIHFCSSRNSHTQAQTYGDFCAGNGHADGYDYVHPDGSTNIYP